MNINQMKEILPIAHKSQNSIHMIGQHGIGKTEIVKSFAKEQGYHCEVLQLTVMDTGDLMGMPVIEDTKNGKITTWAKPVWLQRIEQANERGQHCVVFFDELGRASIDIRQAALQMVLEGKIQEHSLGELDDLKSLIVVADNPSDEYDTADFDGALEDRFMTFDVEASVTGFLEYARETGISPIIRDYLAENQEKLVFQPEDDEDKGSTPRAWEALSRALKNTPDDFPHLSAIIKSKIGTTVGSSFFHFFNNYINVVSVKDVKEALKDTPLKTEKQQKSAAEKLKKLTEKIETLSSIELAEKLVQAFEKGEVLAEEIVVYLASLPLETSIGIMKTWKNSDKENLNKFYTTDLTDAQPNKWFIFKIISMKED